MGRLLNRDPIGGWGGIHIFSFCINSSTDGFDYLGMYIGLRYKEWSTYQLTTKYLLHNSDGDECVYAIMSYTEEIKWKHKIFSEYFSKSEQAGNVIGGGSLPSTAGSIGKIVDAGVAFYNETYGNDEPPSDAEFVGETP